MRLYEELSLRSAWHVYGAAEVYLRHLSQGPESFTFFALSDGHRIRAICPLEHAGRRLAFLHVPAWGMPHHLHWTIFDVICPDGEARDELVPRLVEHLRRTPGSPPILALGPAHEHSAAWEGLSRLHPSEYVIDMQWRSHVIDCRRSFGETEASLSKSNRSRMRLSRNRLAKHQEVRFARATTPEDLTTELESFLAVEASGWKGPRGTRTAIQCNPALIEYYRDLVATLGATGNCEINTLYADGTCIAGELCFLGREEYIIPKVGYDEEYARMTPGKLVFEKVLERCCGDEVVERLNYLTETPWLTSFGASSEPVNRAVVAVAPVRGRALVAAFRLQWSIRRLVRALRARWARS